MITVKNITDAQISRLRAESYRDGDYMMLVVCDLALQGDIDTDDYTVLDAHEVKRISGMSREDAYVEIVSVLNDAEGKVEAVW